MSVEGIELFVLLYIVSHSRGADAGSEIIPQL